MNNMKFISLAEEKIEFKPSSKAGIIFFGPKNNFPDEIVNLYNNSTLNGSILRSKIDQTFGKGLTITDASILSQLEYMCQNDVQTFVYDLITDLMLYDGVSINTIWSKDRTQIARLKHIPFNKVRAGMPSDDEVNTYFVSNNWQTRNVEKDMYIKLNKDLAKDFPSQIMYSFKKNPGSDYYPVPSYFQGLNYIRLEQKLANYFNNYVSNGMSANLMITLFDSLADEEKAYIANQLKQCFTGDENAGKFILNVAPDIEHKPVIEPISSGDSFELFKTIIEHLQNSIMASHRITASELIGVPSAGSSLGGDSNKIKVAYQMMDYLDLQQKRNFIEEQIYKILKISNIQVKREDIKIESNFPAFEEGGVK